MTTEIRFATKFEQEDSDDPGLVLEDDGTVKVVLPDGTRRDVTQPGVPIVRKFPFAFNTPGILTGATLYTPTAGDIILDAWLETVTAWDGTTPLFDFGVFINHIGWITQLTFGGPPDLSAGADAETVAGNNLLASAMNFAAWLPLAGTFGNQGQWLFEREMPGKLIGAVPIKVVVSQNGADNGADPGASQGAAILYLVTATPA